MEELVKSEWVSECTHILLRTSHFPSGGWNDNGGDSGDKVHATIMITTRKELWNEEHLQNN